MSDTFKVTTVYVDSGKALSKRALPRRWSGTHPQSFRKTPAPVPTDMEIAINLLDLIATREALQDTVDQHLEGQLEMTQTELAFISGAITVLSTAADTPEVELQKVF